jgi:hypothetical protein
MLSIQTAFVLNPEAAFILHQLGSQLQLHLIGDHAGNAEVSI